LRTLRSSGVILLVTGAYLLVGVGTFVEWRITGNDSWIEGFFQSPGALLALWLAIVNCAFSYRARNFFASSEPMHTAWTLVCLSAACDVVGVLATQILAATSAMNPLFHMSFWSAGLGDEVRQVGLVLGGVCRFGLLAGGLWYAIEAYRRSGLLAGYRWLDHALLGIMAAYVISEIVEVMTAIRDVRRPTLVQIAGWPVDPLLWFLLAQALLLRRSAKAMGGGWIGRCWKTMSAGVVLVAAGDVMLMATRMGYLPWPYSALEWYIWLPAAAAFALAPAYQIEAVAHASEISILRSE
jgi:hypothetical protein